MLANVVEYIQNQVQIVPNLETRLYELLREAGTGYQGILVVS